MRCVIVFILLSVITAVSYAATYQVVLADSAPLVVGAVHELSRAGGLFRVKRNFGGFGGEYGGGFGYPSDYGYVPRYDYGRYGGFDGYGGYGGFDQHYYRQF